jgi:hypothetical protein
MPFIMPPMTNEFDRKFLPEMFQSALTLSMGASIKGLEMMKHPQNTLERMVDEARALVTPPEESGSSLPDKAKAMASVWIERGSSWVEECRTAGENFTEDKDAG